MKNLLLSTLVVVTMALPALSQMTSQQREFDFDVLASLYAKRYGPANWKLQALGVNIFDLRAWKARVRAAKSDLEYYEIASEYVASFQDGHSTYRLPSNFFADLGIAVDIYEGKVLLEAWNTAIYPRADFPFALGDELVSLDGKPVSELIDTFSKHRGFGNPRGARRLAAEQLTFRSQSVNPRAHEIGDTSEAEFIDAAGERKKYTLKWTKTGTPIIQNSPVPSPFSAQRSSAQQEIMKPLEDLRNWAVPETDLLLARRLFEQEDGEVVEKSFVLGYGARNPYYQLPPNFQIRLGRLATDTFYSGTYSYEGLRIGYLRIPNFSPTSAAAALAQLDAEMTFFKANTDGLVIDVSRNTGGGCIGLDYAQRLLPEQFYFFGEQLRPTQSLLISFSNSLRIAELLRAETWVIETYKFIVAELESALKANRAMTGPLPACSSVAPGPFLAPTLNNLPLRTPDGSLVAYTKPIIFLADEFSVSFGDIFPAMMQDNRRGPIVGMRTGGLGGSVSSWPAGFFSEATSSNTNSLVLRRDNIVSSEFPTAPYIENIGVRPDIELDYMTKENLVRRGAPFVDAFSKIIVEEIRKKQ